MAGLLHVHLLGDFRLRYDGAVLTAVDTPRQRSLLAYLVLHCAAPQPRQDVAFRLWPDSTEAQARTNLRRELHHLRRSLPDPDRYLVTDTKTLQWRDDDATWADVRAFDCALADTEAAGGDGARRAALEEALRLYTGDLLPGGYDEWLLADREGYRARYVGAVEQLAALLEAERDYVGALAQAQRLLRAEPTREATYQTLMRLHALNDDRAAALQVYHRCTSTLRRELGVEPSAATRALYDRLVGTRDAPTAAAEERSAAPAAALIGRQAEWAAMQAAWRAAQTAGAHVLVVSGEAGIGKTRLVEELLAALGRQGIATATARAYAAAGRLAYAPIAEWLRSGPLNAGLAGLEALWLTEVARVLPEVLVERPELPPPAPLTQSWQRGHLFAALLNATRRVGPVVLHLDDVQWADADTLEWLAYALRSAREKGRLLVLTARPAEVEPDHALGPLLAEWRSRGQVTVVELGPLEPAETAALAAQVMGKELSAEAAHWLHAATGGNPLFVVESARAGLTAGAAPDAAEAALPATVRAREDAAERLPPGVRTVIAGRLAQLSPGARSVAWLAAAVGREFTFAVLLQAGDLDEDAVVRGLDELWRRGMIREQGRDAYDFSHDGLRDVVYTEISPVQRRWLHRRIAAALETLHARDLDAVAGRLAAHHEAAGQVEAAIAYHERAARGARRLLANAAAAAHLQHAVGLLQTLPETQDRDRAELRLHLALGAPLSLTRGWAAPEAWQVYSRARLLIERTGEHGSLFAVLDGLFTNIMTRGDVARARSLADETLQLVEGGQDSQQRVAAYWMVGCTLFHAGDFAAAREYVSRALAEYGEGRTQPNGLDTRADFGIFSQVYLTHSLWFLGEPVRSLAASQSALALAERLRDPFARAMALDYAAMLHQMRREVDRVQEYAAAAEALCAEHGFAYYRTWASFLSGWVDVERARGQGEMDSGLARMGTALTEFDAAGAGLRRPYYLALLAEAQAKAGHPDAAVALVRAAIERADATGEHYYDAELRRLDGTLQAGGGDEAAAVARLGEAVAIAQRQGAVALELRAAAALYALRGDEATRAALARVHAACAAGGETADLREAGRLLGGGERG